MALLDAPALPVDHDLAAALGGLADEVDDAVDSGLVHLERLAPRPARPGRLGRPFPSDLADALDLGSLWSHQAEAIDLARAGRSVVVATGTASGKSRCYQAPVAEAVNEVVAPGTGLCLFPTKALAHDQLRAFGDLDLPGLVACTYDGDATKDERSWARANANVVLTNPEMLHGGLLPHHARWATFLMRLRYVVVDELHVLRGIFGSHVGHLLRRLRRLCEHYGADPTFIFTSATIGDPARLASDLCGKPVAEVTRDGSPRGERLVALWAPDGQGSTGRTAAGLTARLVTAGHRTITFCRSRKGTEVVTRDVQRRLGSADAALVRAYRGGYLVEERRAIEDDLFSGRLRAVVATTALELGVDIGGLDACVLSGFPGTIASMWQQAGRAGRDGGQSLAVLVAGDDQLDHWLLDHPDQLFSRPPEPAVINPANPYVFHPHLACAAFEMPLSRDDERFWPNLLDDGVRDLVADGALRIRSRRRHGHHWPTAVWAGDGYPAHGVGLRSGSSHEFRIATEDGDLVGTVDESRALRQVHQGAVYLHQGRTFVVDELDIADRRATVSETGDEVTTRARSESDIRVLEIDDRRTVGASQLHLGSVEVTSQVTGYERRDLRTGELLGREHLDLPIQHLVTRAVWYTIDEAVLAAAGVGPGTGGPGTLHAVEHAAIALLPLFTICDRWDVGGVSTMRQADTRLPTIVIHDAYPGGAGIAELAYSVADRHLAATLEVVEACFCDDGCPSCVQSPKCGNGNEPLDKAGAVRLLTALLS